MVSLHNYYLFIILDLECSTHLELVILLKGLQIVQFIECVNVGLQLDWNGVLKVFMNMYI
jgi:hypothetical protein